MASFCEDTIVPGGKNTESFAMDDGRGFTTAGKDHIPPEFNSSSNNNSPNKRNRKFTTTATTTSSSRQRPFSVPAPIGPISLEDLDLDSTVEAGESFLSYSSSEEEELQREGGGRGRGYVESTIAGTSYSKAMKRGMKSVTVSHLPRGRKHSMLHSIKNRLRSNSVISTAEDLDSKSLMSAKFLRKELQKQDESGTELDTNDLLFTIMSRKYSKPRKKAKLLATVLTFSDTSVNQRAPSGMTALHHAVQDNDYESVKVLVAFGANINATNQNGKTPLDLLCPDAQDMESTVVSPSSLSLPDSTASTSPSPSPDHVPVNPPKSKRKSKSKEAHQKCISLLKSIGGYGRDLASRLSSVPTVEPFPEVPSSSPTQHRKMYAEVLDWEAKITSHYSDLERNINSRLQNTTRAGREAMLSPDVAISLAAQLQEMVLFQKAGSRILCLDGGGIKGLIQLEILSQLEIKTGRRIVELFDWIVGSSTGGIIALGLVYAKKTLTELRQMYFRIKDEVFGKVKGAVSFNTVGLERILKKEFTETRCMDDETYPRVLISAVKKDKINLKLHFFNNCFNDDYCKNWPVWKVARYTGAAPVLFGEADEYVDGGLLANNPSESGLSRIQSFYRSRGEKIPISLLVSVGCGKHPTKALGNVDFLFVGGHGWSSLAGTSNLMSLLSYALGEPSVADDNCRSRCEEQGVRYFRLNPRLEEVVASGETDLQVLVDSILQTRKEMCSRPEFANLVLCLHELSDSSRRMHARLNGTDSSDSSLGSST